MLSRCCAKSVGFVFVAFGLTLGVRAAAQPAVPPSYDIWLPSESTGIPGGRLAVRVYSATAPRYPAGAPVVVFATGGSSGGSLSYPIPEEDDLVLVAFNFPGGSSGGRTSDGTYDDRGPACIAALRDVTLYAAGQLADEDGLTIGDLLGSAPLADRVGLLGSSNGGNIVVAVVASHGHELAPYLSYLVQWESPVSSQAAVVEVGGVNVECPGSNERRDYVNPRYLAYGPLELSFDHSDLAYDPAGEVVVFYDGDGDGVYTTQTDASGCTTPDFDLDGVLESNEDYPLSGYPNGTQSVHSRSVTQALSDLGVFGTSWPSSIATVDEANAYWNLREAVRLVPAARDRIPGLAVMLVASADDHVQSDPNHFHIRQAFESWDLFGTWVQINPDPAWMLELDPSMTGVPDNEPNLAPADWGASSYLEPEGPADQLAKLAAIHQMADRGPAFIFRDGFASADTAAWSAAVP